MKLDADAYATDESPLVTEEMKQYVIYGHRWGRSRAEHIEQLDKWAAEHPRLDTRPMFDPASVKGDKFHHPRTQSFAQLHSSQFTRDCHELAGGRMPVPSHDTYMFYVAERLGHEIGRVDFKSRHGINHCSSLRRLRERVPAEPKSARQPGVPVQRRSGLAVVGSQRVIRADVGDVRKTRTVGRANDDARDCPRHAAELLRVLGSLPRGIRCGAEVGVLRGESSRVLLERLPDLRLYMVDAWAVYAPHTSYYLSGDSAARLTAERQEAHRREATSSTEFAADRRVVLHMDSRTAADRVKDLELDFAFLDADHTYEAIAADLRRWWPKVRVGGFLCGHDFGHPRDRRGIWGVSRAVNEFAEEYQASVQTGHSTVWWVVKEAVAEVSMKG